MAYLSGLGATNIAYTGGATAPGYVFGTSGRALILGGTKAPARQTVVYQRPTVKLPVVKPIPATLFPRGKIPVLKFPTVKAPTPVVKPIVGTIPTPAALAPSFSTAGSMPTVTAAADDFGDVEGEVSSTSFLSTLTKQPMVLVALAAAGLFLLSQKKGRK